MTTDGPPAGDGSGFPRSARVPTQAVLSNGMTLLNIPVPGSRMGGVYIVVKAGSRDETPATAGLDHFGEHLFFKGTRNRPTAAAIVNEIGLMGSSTNAETQVESTVYYITGAASQLDHMADILADMLTHPNFDAEEFERERNVVLQELASASSSPDEWISENTHAVAFGGNQPMSWSAGGHASVVRRVTREQLLAYHRDFYRPDRMALVVVGGEGMTVARAEELLKDLPAVTKPARRRIPSRWGQGPDYISKVVPAESPEDVQVSFRLLLPGLAASSRDQAALSMMTMILGGDMWSRLFSSIRERQGLAYEAFAEHDAFDDAGIFEIGMATAPNNAARATSLAIRELKALAADGPTGMEMQIALATTTTSIYEEAEQASAQGYSAAQRWAAGKPLLHADAKVARYAAVTAADVRRMARLMESRLPQARLIAFGTSDRSVEIMAAAGRRNVRGPQQAAPQAQL